MIKLLRLLLAVAGLILIVLLAINNRGPVDLVFWPHPFRYQVPLYWVFLFGLLVGAILGGLSLWLAGWSSRSEARSMRRRVREMDYQERLKRERDDQAILEQARRKTQAIAIEAPHA